MTHGVRERCDTNVVNTEVLQHSSTYDMCIIFEIFVWNLCVSEVILDLFSLFSDLKCTRKANAKLTSHDTKKKDEKNWSIFSQLYSTSLVHFRTLQERNLWVKNNFSVFLIKKLYDIRRVLLWCVSCKKNKNKIKKNNSDIFILFLYDLNRARPFLSLFDQLISVSNIMRFLFCWFIIIIKYYYYQIYSNIMLFLFCWFIINIIFIFIFFRCLIT